MALYRFLFAPILLAVAVLTSSPRRAAPPPPSYAELRPTTTIGAHAPPVRAARAVPSHPPSVH